MNILTEEAKIVACNEILIRLENDLHLCLIKSTAMGTVRDYKEQIQKRIDDWNGRPKTIVKVVADNPLIPDNFKLVGYSADDDNHNNWTVERKKSTKQIDLKSKSTCCYCEDLLTRHTYTRDHIVPKSKGGSFTMACCVGCNSEKGSMRLKEYIICLNQSLSHFKGEQLIRLQRKISNANKLAKEINL